MTAREQLPLKVFWLALAVWNGLLYSAPLLVNSSSKALQYLGSAVYFFMDPVCHQLPQRSLWLAALPLPVCARCTAIYLAALLVVSVALLRGTVARLRWGVYLVLLLLALSDVVAEKLILAQTILEWRLLDGFVLGATGTQFLLEGLVRGRKSAGK